MTRRLLPLLLILVSSCSSPPDEFEPVPYVLRVGAWNIEKLGQEEDTDLDLVAEIIDAEFDVIAVSEVMVRDGGHPGFDALLARLGSRWDGWVTDRPRPDVMSSWSEYYAVYWRRELVRPCPGWSGLVYHPDNPGGTGGTGENLFSREPAYGCFEAGYRMETDEPIVGFDLVLAAYHAIYASGDRTVTAAEVDHLDDVFDSMAASVPGETDLVVAGDFNLEAYTIGTVVDCTVITEGEASTLRPDGSLSSNLIDHVVVHEPIAESTGPARILDVRHLAATDETYLYTVSNHLPVVARFQVFTDDD